MGNLVYSELWWNLNLLDVAKTCWARSDRAVRDTVPKYQFSRWSNNLVVMLVGWRNLNLLIDQWSDVLPIRQRVIHMQTTCSVSSAEASWLFTFWKVVLHAIVHFDILGNLFVRVNSENGFLATRPLWFCQNLYAFTRLVGGNRKQF